MTMAYTITGVVAAGLLFAAWLNRAPRPVVAEPVPRKPPESLIDRLRREQRSWPMFGAYVPDYAREDVKRSGDPHLILLAAMSVMVDMKHLELDAARDRYQSRLRAAGGVEPTDAP